MIAEYLVTIGSLTLFVPLLLWSWLHILNSRADRVLSLNLFMVANSTELGRHTRLFAFLPLTAAVGAAISSRPVDFNPLAVENLAESRRARILRN